MTLLLKISKTKKRLSNDRFIFLHCLSFGITALLAVSAYSFRLLAFPRHWTMTEFDIPVVKDASELKNLSSETLAETTPAVVLSTKALYFGSLNSFSKKFEESDEKFMIPHIDGRLDLTKIRTELSEWAEKMKLHTPQTVVIVPTSDAPLASLVQLVNYLRNEKIFDSVILGGGIH